MNAKVGSFLDLYTKRSNQKGLQFHRRIQDFFRGGLKDKFILMCTDCIAVKSLLFR